MVLTGQTPYALPITLPTPQRLVGPLTPMQQKQAMAPGVPGSLAIDTFTSKITPPQVFTSPKGFPLSLHTLSNGHQVWIEQTKGGHGFIRTCLKRGSLDEKNFLPEQYPFTTWDPKTNRFQELVDSPSQYY